MALRLQSELTNGSEVFVATLRGTPSRYFTLVDVGAARVPKAPRSRAVPPAEVWLIARSGSWPDSHLRTRLLLWRRCKAADLRSLDMPNRTCVGRAHRDLPSKFNAYKNGNSERCVEKQTCPMSIEFRAGIHLPHNAAWLAVDGRVLGVAGMFRKRLRNWLTQPAAPGAFAFNASGWQEMEYLASVTGVPISGKSFSGGSDTSITTPILRGDHPGCVERRVDFADAGCEFDGRFSMASTADGVVYVYARANLDPHAGGRHVQVARGPSLAQLGQFHLIEIDGEPTWPERPAWQLYFGAVKANPADGGRSLIGLFPVSHNTSSKRDAFIGLAISCDGVHFSPWLRAAESDLSQDGERTIDHPVDGLVSRGALVHFFVQRDVPGITPRPGSPRAAHRHGRLVQKTVHLKSLRAFTDDVKRSSRWCAPKSKSRRHNPRSVGLR